MPYDIKGNWKAGWALDLHTLSSVHNADGSYENKRSEIGEALYQLKYKQDFCKLDFLAKEMVTFLKTRLVLPYLNVILPTPSSFTRESHPVYELAQKVGGELNIPVDMTFIKKVISTSQLKEVRDIEQRKQLIKGAFAVENGVKYQNKKVLIIDDLFRSGITLNELTETLYQEGNVDNVYVVTLTKTRSNK